MAKAFKKQNGRRIVLILVCVCFQRLCEYFENYLDLFYLLFRVIRLSPDQARVALEEYRGPQYEIEKHTTVLYQSSILTLAFSIMMQTKQVWLFIYLCAHYTLLSFETKF